MTQLPDPPSRQDRQQQTRDALIVAARDVFSNDGYHAASLDRIARVAGYSKGAVYSNFAGKSDLFLAVMDVNLQESIAERRNPFEELTQPTSTDRDPADREGYPTDAVKGFALATLEFIATAARDETLAPQLHQRLDAGLEYYKELAKTSRAEGEPLSSSDLGTLLLTLDQGAGLVLLAGGVLPDRSVFNTGMRRLLDPARAVAEERARGLSE
ncbi:TetR/AcrR family transcriptional regulator [Brevibacterium yomogidense]|uniref:TetR/AcrR family transcriptional regulator n=1 Tax=Brevibacterium yomogidense TaxID=946573 RepID=UPI0018DF848A|nr:TetR/AcrR family transcriptional regulator [Brevibacterium yomogidense]